MSNGLGVSEPAASEYEPETVSDLTVTDLTRFDAEHVWHPYGPIPASVPSIFVDSAHGIYLRLADGSEVIDGMSSWWAACHGHSHPALVKSAPKQVHTMSHVMFGGLTHRPAIHLARKLLDMCNGALDPNASEQSSASEEASGSTQASAREQLDAVFFSDSGSVSVEVLAPSPSRSQSR